MKPLIYFFGTLPNGFSSYPQDHTKAFFEEFIKRSRNELQIVVHRSDNLLHYGYVRQLGHNNFFGICICIDRIYNDVGNIFKICDDIFADIIRKGDILNITSNHTFAWATKSFIDEAVAIAEYSKKIVNDLQVSSATTQELPPPDYSISINDCLDISLEAPRGNIIDASKRYPNLYIVKKNAEIERVTSFISQLNAKEGKILELQKEVQAQKEQASEARKEALKAKAKQRNMLWVGILSVAVAILGAILYFKVINPSEVTRYQTGEFIYYGPLKNKKPHGVGVAIYPEDDYDSRKYYIGNFENGERQDEEAVLFYQNGDYFYGSMTGDEWDHGIYFSNSSSSHFQGTFRNNKPYNGTWFTHQKLYDVMGGEEQNDSILSIL